MKSCSVANCLKPACARGFCDTHYARFRRYGAPIVRNRPSDIDLAGRRFGKLTALHRSADQDTGRLVWYCQCDCGAVTKVSSGHHLLSGNTKSCGCLRRAGNSNRTHEMSSTTEYRVWLGIKKRCLNKNEPSYRNYGARGISMCPEWQESFLSFFNDMGKRPPGHSLDRIDNNQGYCKENCRWATRDVQNSNKRSNWHITALGKTMLLKDWAKETGINRTTLAYRIKNLGWDYEKALTKTVR